jgi:hypothetical protein
MYVQVLIVSHNDLDSFNCEDGRDHVADIADSAQKLDCSHNHICAVPQSLTLLHKLRVGNWILLISTRTSYAWLWSSIALLLGCCRY